MARDAASRERLSARKAGHGTIDWKRVAAIAEKAGMLADEPLLNRIEGVASDHATRKVMTVDNLRGTRRTLRTCSAALRKGATGLRSMEPGASSLLAGIYRGELPSRRDGDVSLPHPIDDAAAALRLADMLDALLRDLPARGRPRSILLDDLIQALAELYEDTTGNDFSFFDKRQRNRSSSFVATMAAAIDPDLTTDAIQGAMRRFTEIRNRLKNKA